MFKTTFLTAALLATATASASSDASAGTNKAGAAAAATLVQRAKSDVKRMHTLQHAKALDAVKLARGDATLSLQAQAQTKTKVQAKGVSKSSLRALRGKAGKGKGKGKDDDEEEEEEGEWETMARSYLSMSAGICAGGNFAGDTMAADTYLYIGQMVSGSCENMVDSDGMTYSMKTSFTAEPFSIMESVHSMHDCKDDYYVSSMDVTSDFTFGGAVTANGVCTDLGGYAVRLMVSDTSVTMPPGFVATTENMHVNDCKAGDISSYDFVDMEAAGITLSGGYMSMCFSENDSDDDTLDDSLFGSYAYDVSGCGGDPASLTITSFSDSDCTVSTGSDTESAKYCSFDFEHFVEEMTATSSATFLYTSQFCSPL